MHLKHSIAVLLLLFAHQVLGADTLAIRQLQFAFNACERGLQSEKPESQGSFRVLQSLLKKYENNRDSALQKVPNLKNSENERYSGTLLDGKTFVEAFHICENDLYEKVAAAEQYIIDKKEKRKARQKAHQAEIDATLRKINQAKQEVTVAINQNCMQFMRAPEAKSRHLYDNYVVAKQKALALYPKIVKQFHEINTVDVDTEETVTEVKTVQYWFNQCEESFAEQGYQPASTVEVIPPAAAPIIDSMASQPVVAPVVSMASMTQPVADEDNEADLTEEKSTEKDDETVEMDADTTEEDPEYKAILAKVQGDRLKTLTTEGRLPDFSNDDEGIVENATEWQYETEDSSQCITYVFKDNSLVHTKNNKGECL